MQAIKNYEPYDWPSRETKCGWLMKKEHIVQNATTGVWVTKGLLEEGEQVYSVSSSSIAAILQRSHLSGRLIRTIFVSLIFFESPYQQFHQLGSRSFIPLHPLTRAY